MNSTMNVRSLIYVLPLLFLTSMICQGQTVTSPASSDAEIPHLRKQGTATQLIVDGKPFLLLAGELGNNTATSIEYMKCVWPKLVNTKLNSVLAAVSWDQIEPEEGKFNFSVLDSVIHGARVHNLHMVLLWFGSWKNGSSTYAPDWVKRDFERFPRVKNSDGRSVEILTPFSDANRDADAQAFAALMRHIRQVDGQQHTIVMIQVENEIFGRDQSSLAIKSYGEQVPKELINYLQKHKGTLIPELQKVWETAGFKTSGTWEEVFGKCVASDEIFMAWYFSNYVGKIATLGKAEYPLPMFVNSWGWAFPKTGEKTNGAPMSDVFDVWRAGAPQIDIISPDIYDSDFASMCSLYTRSGNPLFIPETRGFPPNNLATRVLYAFGRFDAIGFSPMGIERPATPDIELVSAYEVIAQLAPLISAHQGDGTMSAVLIGANDPPQKVSVGNYTLEVSYLMPRVQPPTPKPQPPFPNAAAIFIQTGPEEFYAAGTGVNVKFLPNTPGPQNVGLATVEEGVFVNGKWVPGRRLAGDDTGDESLVLPRLHEEPDHPALFGPSQKGIQRVTLYRYR
jgi:Domain of unknown function (DUF5597)/Beta-galactosidase